MIRTEKLYHVKKPINTMLHLDALKTLHFINSKSGRTLDARPLSEIAHSTTFKAHLDDLFISVNAVGQNMDDVLIASVKQAKLEEYEK
ncbi:hypothetical protein KQI10_01260 [Pseudoflavonifractor sp. MSJ-30]|uniref:hypothetical protein n=1 Tax=Pseudoflavonifractor sp. MSJ-30 TaxID=2841525 RepID=UPI001C10DB66|nr:hypothetical protein [Pseudoflavonifractor sp. MSJ-30]MBU5451805.1 hypothetical protein [Pseudoflavonifractor sp. MSJ-30]